MAIGVNIPNRQRANNSSLLSLAGMAGGGAVGGFAGAGIGGQLGGMAGGMMADKSQAPEAVQANALQRRQGSLDDSAQRQIANSIDSLKFIEDDAQRMELAKPLVLAQMASQKKSGGFDVG